MSRTLTNSVYKSAIVAILLSSTVSAGNSSGLLGIGASYYHFKSNDNIGLEHDYSVPSLDLRIGAKNSDWRFLVGYSFIKDDTVAGATAENILVTGELDYIFYTVPMQNQTLFQPFIGGTLGYHGYKYGNTIDENGVAYGAQVGAIFDFENFSIDTTAKYMDSSNDNSNEFYGLSVGFNYKLNND